ncbi:hypothetical protein ACQ4LE_002292 [Meloidogyne hapla]|uniref:DNA-binding protein n=1 Tax=Meloidogyne hapla TaxID=6305 RepID=A0A1I8B191_MELHA
MTDNTSSSSVSDSPQPIAGSPDSIADNVDTFSLFGPLTLREVLHRIRIEMEDDPVMILSSGVSGDRVLEIYNCMKHPPEHPNLELPFSEVVEQFEEEAAVRAANQQRDLAHQQRLVIPITAKRENGQIHLTDICERCEDTLMGPEIGPHQLQICQHEKVKTTDSQHLNYESVDKSVATRRKTTEVVSAGKRKRMIGCRVRTIKALRVGKKIYLTAFCVDGKTRVVWQPDDPHQA